MRHCVISGGLNFRDIERMSRELEAERKLILKNLQTLCFRLVDEIGRPQAMWAFGYTAGVVTEQRENGAVLTAFPVGSKPQAMYILEFGAGLTAGSKAMNGEYDAIPVPITPGSWSQSSDGRGQYIPGVHESWRFGGVTFTHISPVAPMYNAYKRMEQEFPRIANEVFQ